MSIEKRASSISFNRSTSDVGDDHLSVDETYLAQLSQTSGCCGTVFPIPFERAAGRSWWDPTFDSDILEEQYRKSVQSRNRSKFR